VVHQHVAAHRIGQRLELGAVTVSIHHPDPMSVSTAAGASAFKDLYANWTLGSGTNRDQGLYAVAEAAPHYDAVVVLTDGNPTYWDNPRQGDGSHTHFADVEGGVFAAGAVKAEDTHVVALGVGRGVEGISGLNLRAISATEAFDGSNPTTADRFRTTDFEAAGDALHDIALTHCDGTLSVIEQIVLARNTGEDVTGAVSAGGGREFTATPTTPDVGGLPDRRRRTPARSAAWSFGPRSRRACQRPTSPSPNPNSRATPWSPGAATTPCARTSTAAPRCPSPTPARPTPRASPWTSPAWRRSVASSTTARRVPPTSPSRRSG